MTKIFVKSTILTFFNPGWANKTIRLIPHSQLINKKVNDIIISYGKIAQRIRAKSNKIFDNVKKVTGLLCSFSP